MRGFDWGSKTAGELMSQYEINKANREEDAKREKSFDASQGDELRALDAAGTHDISYENGKYVARPKAPGTPTRIAGVDELKAPSQQDKFSAGFNAEPAVAGQSVADVVKPQSVPEVTIAPEAQAGSAPEAQSIPAQEPPAATGEQAPAPVEVASKTFAPSKQRDLTRQEIIDRHTRDAGVYTKYGMLDHARDLESRAQAMTTADQQSELSKRLLAEHDAKMAQIEAFNGPLNAHREKIDLYEKAKNGDLQATAAMANWVNPSFKARVGDDGKLYASDKSGVEHPFSWNDKIVQDALTGELAQKHMKDAGNAAIEQAMMSSPESAARWLAAKETSQYHEALLKSRDEIAALQAAVRAGAGGGGVRSSGGGAATSRSTGGGGEGGGGYLGGAFKDSTAFNKFVEEWTNGVTKGSVTPLKDADGKEVKFDPQAYRNTFADVAAGIMEGASGKVTPDAIGAVATRIAQSKFRPDPGVKEDLSLGADGTVTRAVSVDGRQFRLGKQDLSDAEVRDFYMKNSASPKEAEAAYNGFVVQKNYAAATSVASRFADLEQGRSVVINGERYNKQSAIRSLFGGDQDEYNKAVESANLDANRARAEYQKVHVDDNEKSRLAGWESRSAPKNDKKAFGGGTKPGAEEFLPKGIGGTYQERVTQITEKRKAAAEDKDLIALDAKRAQALRANKPADANNAIAEINRIRRERYGI
jgi:hypothetical protein